MKQGELMQQLSAHNVWWQREDWERDDADLGRLVDVPFDYRPNPLGSIRPDGLYFLRGPRRVGKSVEVKRTIARLIRSGVSAKAVIHFACNGLARTDLQNLVRAAERLSPPSEEPRYWFLDEITAAKDDWSDGIAHLRDNNARFKRDCVVLTGSSTRNLDRAIKALAGRRGLVVSGDDRTLLPAGFRSFCQIIDGAHVPDPSPLRTRDFAVPGRWRSAAYELSPFLDELVGLWDLYLTIGGFPRAMADFLADGSVSAGFVGDLWQVIYGEAIRSKSYGAVQIERLLSELSQRLTDPTNFTQLAEDCGFADHSVASDRCDDLVAAYTIWPCYPLGPMNLPHLKAQRKFYFYDPLLARLAHLLDQRNPDPPHEHLSEQQLALSIRRALELERPSGFTDHSQLMFQKTPSRNEIDFVSPHMNRVAFESKYVDAKETRAASAIKAQRVTGFLASRSLFDPDAPVAWLPASFIAWLLDHGSQRTPERG